MRILYINSLYAPHIGGGAEITLQAQCEGMQRAGHAVSVLTIGPEEGLLRSEVNGVEVWRAGYRNLYFHHRSERSSPMLRLAWHLRDRYNRSMREYVHQVVEGFKPDVASCHNLSGWSISVWDELTALGIPIVQVLHDQYLLCPKSTMFNDGDRCSIQCAPCKALRVGHRSKSTQVSGVVGVSSFIKEKLVANGYFQGVDLVTSIKNVRSVDLAALPNSARASDGLLVFGFIGTLAPSKGIEVLLKAFIRDAGPNWRLRIAGAGLKSYEASLRQSYSDDRIEFLGHVRPETFFPEVDATVVPSVWEDTLPGVVFESFIFGKPVLGSSRGGIAEMLKPETGISFEPTVDAIGAAMIKYSESQSIWKNRFSSIKDEGLSYTREKEWIGAYEEVFERVKRAGR